MNPSSRSSRKRLRHLPTVGIVTRSWSATCVLLRPEGQADTMRERIAKRRAFGAAGPLFQRQPFVVRQDQFLQGRPVFMGVLQHAEGFALRRSWTDDY